MNFDSYEQKFQKEIAKWNPPLPQQNRKKWRPFYCFGTCEA